MGYKASVVNDSNFDSEVLNSPDTVLLQFSTPWCAPCRTFGPILESLAEDFDGSFKLCKIDAEENYKIASKYGINSVPTIIIFKDGKPIDKVVGMMSKQALSEKIGGIIKVG
jgi:thioredoxin 1